MPEYRLRPPETAEEWATYHTIRRRVLFERRGIGSTYDPEHPDEHKPGNHPLVLLHDDRIVGVVRIDIVGGQAILRRVAIAEPEQGRGHGQRLLELANAFAQHHGCDELRSFVAPDAVGFYQRAGFRRGPGGASPGGSILMERRSS